MKYRQQYDSSDCGAACLAMIASFYGANLNIAEIRHYAGTDSDGTNFHGMVKASNHYGLKARAVEGNNESINTNIPTPFIAHMKTEKDKVGNHYVVVRKIFNNKILIFDPDKGKKIKLLTYEKFFEYWTGYAIFLEPDVGFTKTDKKENLLFKFIPVFLPHKKLLAFSFLRSNNLFGFCNL